ncbi:MAG TPA: FAD binding domain-containing protein [Puia sp.]|nr:FAD binding domain-containing protein [Puia sp.]
MIRFILNNKLIHTDKPPGMLLLDFVRYHERLMGTKIGCREGDCGACTVVLGELKGGKLRYRSAVSCLTALGNVHGKQVVTIEGVNREEGLNPLQQAICEEGGTQCGFCTPGFIVSMAGFCLGEAEFTYKNALAAVDGNICRCTGYKSIQRALGRVVSLLQERSGQDLLPDYFRTIEGRLRALLPEPNGFFSHQQGAPFLGGGTDLYVQQQERMEQGPIDFLFNREGLKGVVEESGRCWVGGAATVSDLVESPLLQKAFPRLDQYARLISSTPIRNIATVAGNFVNASPIGDLSIFFLALDARLVLNDGVGSRELPLRELYRGYKDLAKRPEEFIERIYFDMPGPGTLFHFEKVSKRTCLDIASVNTAMRITVSGSRIVEAHLAAGGVGPIPAFLAGASALMRGRKVEEELVLEVIEAAQGEIAPISDARGAAAYKRLLLGQLIKAHFLTLFPGLEAARLI